MLKRNALFDFLNFDVNDTSKFNRASSEKSNNSLRQYSAEKPAAHPFQELRRLAQMWSMNSDVDRKGFASKTNKDKISPEIIASEAEYLGLVSEYTERKLTHIAPSDLPCLLLLKSGLCYLLCAISNKKWANVNINGQEERIAFDELKDVYAGAIIRLRRDENRLLQNNNKSLALLRHFLSTQGFVRELTHQMLQKCDALLWQLALAAALSNLFLIAVPSFVMIVYDRIIPHFALETLWALTIGITIILTLDFALRSVRSKLIDAAGITINLKIQSEIFHNTMRMEYGSAPKMTGGLSAGLHELEGLCYLLPKLFTALLIDIPFFLIIIAFLYYIGGQIVVAPLIGVVAIIAVHFFGYLRAMKYQKNTSELMQLRNDFLNDYIPGLKTIKSASAENKTYSYWQELVDVNSFHSHKIRNYINLYSQATLVISQAIIVLTLIIGVYQVKAGVITVGALAAATLIVGRALSPFSNVLALTFQCLHHISALHGLERIMDANLENIHTKVKSPKSQISGKIAFCDVSFAYPGVTQPVLQNLNIEITPGEKIGIVGRVGSGKSTLLKLIPRLYQNELGHLKIDDFDIRQYSTQVLREHIAYLPQDYDLFDLSIRENICFGSENVTEENFQRACKISGVTDFLRDHAEGYGMKVGPRGERLSGGEKQAIALARCLLQDARVFVLDEPTSAMDTEFERKVIKNLSTSLQDRTLILSTHRASVLQIVDRVIILDRGRVISDGSRDHILNLITQDHKPKSS